MVKLKIEKFFSKTEQFNLEMQQGNTKQTKHVARIGEIIGARSFLCDRAISLKHSLKQS